MVHLEDLQALCELTPDLLLERGLMLRRGVARETFRWRGRGGEAYIVKRFRRSGPLAAFGRRPARDEFEALERLREAGLPVPEALELFESGGTAVLVMKEIEHSSDLRQRLTARPAEAAAWSPGVLALTLALHTRGWYHRDLYLDHFVLKTAGKGESLALLDLGRARCEARPRRRWFVKDLAALLYSTPTGVSPMTCMRFLSLYLDGRGISGRRQRRWWLDSIQRKARRMAAHTPRGGTSFQGGVGVQS